MRTPTLAALACALLLSTGCGATTTTGTAGSSTGADAAQVGPDAWCQVQLGDTEAAVVERLGKPNSDAANGLPLSGDMTAQAWAAGDVLYLVTFEGGRAANLQAYQGAIGPEGASGLPCEAFRSAG